VACAGAAFVYEGEVDGPVPPVLGPAAILDYRTRGEECVGVNPTHTLLALLAASSLWIACGAESAPIQAGGPVAEWPSYANDPGGMRYSPLDEINRDNVSQLKVAWIYHTGDVSNGEHGGSKSGFENTPIVVDGTMYISTPFCRVVALDPETGAEKWSYDPRVDTHTIYSEGLINRGVSSWLDPDRKPGEPCHRRIFIGTIDARLIALDAANGKLCTDFGADGQVDLKQGVGETLDNYGGKTPVRIYEETSPPAIIDDLVIVGSGIGDNARVDMPSGVVRAFDARTGTVRWSWNPIPDDPAEPAYKTWSHEIPKTGAANTWAPISVDPARELVFLPVSSASPDYYGGKRLGSDLYSDAVVALHAKDGKLAWYFQTTHHDLWDYDNPAMPLLCALRRDGAEVPAVVQGTKRGSLFVLNRESGEPIFGVDERAVPQTDVAGEQTSPTQPFPVLPPPLIPQSLGADEAWGITFWDRGRCRKRMAGLRNEGIYTPPSIGGSLVIPGNTGGMNWSGAAFDPVRQLLVTNVNNLPAEVHLIPRAELQAQIETARSRGLDLEIAPQTGTPYAMSRVFIRSPLGLPCNPPPWGSLVAVDLATGQIRWSVPLGDLSEALPIPLPRTGWGFPSLGGATVTAGGLVFIAGALLDPHLRAFDLESGKTLWSARLPAPGNATPMTYRVRPNGKQYVVIAAGGHAKAGDKRADSLVAFALP